jgi:hypothetical protein
MILLVLLTVLALPLQSFALDYAVRPSLLLQGAYNDNIALTSTNRTGDFIMILTPAIELEARAERLQLSLNYSPSFNRYLSHSEFNYISHQAAARANWVATDQWTFTLAHAFVKTEDPGVIRALEGAGPVTATRNSFTSNSTTGTILYRTTPRLSLNLDGAYTTTSSSAGLSDVTTTAVGLGANYRLTERISALARTRQSFYEYEATGNAQSGDYLVGVSYRLTPTVTVDALGGVVVTTSDASSSTYTGFRGDLTLSKRFEQGTASLAYHQSVIAGTESNEPIRSQQLALIYARPLSPRWDFRVLASYGVYRSLQTETQNTRVISGTGELSYRLSARSSAILSYAYADSNDKLNNVNSYHNNVIMLGLRLSTEKRF